MKIFKYILVLVLVVSGNIVFGQHSFCGTRDDGSMKKRLIENKKSFSYDLESRDEDWIFVPIQFHVVTKGDGTGGIDETRILDELCTVNTNYHDLKIKFYLNDNFNYIKSNSLYDGPGTTFGVSKIKTAKNKFPNALNLFIINSIPSGGIGTTLGYYSPGLDVIVVTKSQFGKNVQTVSHEIGHYFSLFHPFYGWECDPYDESKHGNPVTITKTTCGSELHNTIELMDKSNCDFAADALCDTPPDYNFGLVDPEGDCKLNGPIMDYNGDTIDVMENNYMSYFFNCGDYEFTPMQISAMRADFKSQAREFLHSDYVPDTMAINEDDFAIVYPVNNETTEFYDYVNLNWDDMPGASTYNVTISPASQPSNVQSFYVKGRSNLELYNLEKNKKYRWYVRPFSNSYSCVRKLGGTTFRTGSWTSSTDEFSETDDINIYPNPIISNELYIDAENNIGKVEVQMYDMLGKLIEVVDMDLKSGKNKLNLTHSNYHNGMYNIIIKSTDNNYIRKVLINK